MDEARFTDVYLPKYKTIIETLARKVARRNQELYEDLVQTGMIALWTLEPEKATTNEDAWIRTLIYNKMVSVYRREKRRTNESLETLLAHGAQVAESDSGEAQVITPRGARRRRPPPDETQETEE